MAVINLDTVGRLATGKAMILGAGTATEWPHIFRGASFVTGVDSTSVPGNAEASDQRVFIERGIPAVQIFTGPHADYHRPTDTADRVDAAGLVRIAVLVKEAVAYLAERATPLTVTIGAGPPEAERPASDSGGRRVSFGAVPDFGFQGAGVRLTDVTAGSPAQQAGLMAGDVVTGIDETSIASLQQFSLLLRTLKPGQQVRVRFVRDGSERETTVTIAAR
jgi:C-terminal processing protease CtpA/Prc